MRSAVGTFIQISALLNWALASLAVVLADGSETGTRVAVIAIMGLLAIIAMVAGRATTHGHRPRAFAATFVLLVAAAFTVFSAGFLMVPTVLITLFGTLVAGMAPHSTVSATN